MISELTDDQQQVITESIQQRDRLQRQAEQAQQQVAGTIETIRKLNDLPPDAQLHHDNGQYWFEYDDTDTDEDTE